MAHCTANMNGALYSFTIECGCLQGSHGESGPRRNHRDCQTPSIISPRKLGRPLIPVPGSPCTIGCPEQDINSATLPTKDMQRNARNATSMQRVPVAQQRIKMSKPATQPQQANVAMISLCQRLGSTKDGSEMANPVKRRCDIFMPTPWLGERWE